MGQNDEIRCQDMNNPRHNKELWKVIPAQGDILGSSPASTPFECSLEFQLKKGKCCQGDGGVRGHADDATSAKESWRPRPHFTP